MADHQRDPDANQLYWESDASVAEIADRLGISRRALYDAITPLPARTACPECGGALGFRNRTAADRRAAECASCGAEVTVAAAAAGGREELDSPQIEQERQASASAPMGGSRAVVAVSGLAAGVAFLLGIAIGAVAGYLARRP